MYPRPIPEYRKGLRAGYLAMVWFILFVWLLPLLAIILTAFRTLDDLMAGNYWGWPTQFNLINNFAQVFERTAMGQYFLNSLIITVPSVIAVLVLSTMSGFALSRYPFKGSNLLFAIFIAGNFMPAQVFMIPVRDLTLAFGLYDTFWALILFHVSFSRSGSRPCSCATSSPRCRANCSRRPGPKAPRPTRSSARSSCRWSARPWRRWPS